MASKKKSTNIKKLDSFKKKRKTIKVYFCPKCGSKEVEFVFGFKNLFGIIPTMKCKKCELKGNIFPLLVMNKEDLEKENNKIIKRGINKK